MKSSVEEKNEAENPEPAEILNNPAGFAIAQIEAKKASINELIALIKSERRGDGSFTFRDQSILTQLACWFIFCPGALVMSILEEIDVNSMVRNRIDAIRPSYQELAAIDELMIELDAFCIKSGKQHASNKNIFFPAVSPEGIQKAAQSTLDVIQIALLNAEIKKMRPLLYTITLSVASVHKTVFHKTEIPAQISANPE